MTQGSDAVLARMMALHPKIIDLTLDRVWRLLDALGNPQDRLPPVIHIAGTNGKGSTLAMIRAGLESAGLTTHAYTSPHLARFHERIRVAGTLISEPDLTDLLDECYDANRGASITYFEITTCAAILAFSRVPADYTLLEVGLGGRLDATNVVDQPKLTLITPVSIDHQQFLGETVQEIAAEKAGILKHRVPAIVSAQLPEAEAVIEAQAQRCHAPLHAQNQQWHVWEERGRLVYQDETGLWDLPPPRLIGAHQFQNAGAAITALRLLGLGETAATGAVENTAWPARMQKLRAGPLFDTHPGGEIWLDGGHNPACAESLVESLSRLPNRETFLICGMLNTKDASGYMAPLSRAAKRLIAVPIPDEANSLPPESLAQSASAAGLPAETAPDVAQALAVCKRESPDARILICGSLYLAGHILRTHS